MKFKQKRIAVFAATAVLTVIGVLLQSLAFLLDYDRSARVYAGGALGAIASWFTPAAALLLLLSIAFFFSRDKKPARLPPCSVPTGLFAVMAGFVSVTASVFTAIGLRTAPSSLPNLQTLRVLSLLAVAVSIPAGLYLILSAFSATGTERRLAVLGFFPPLLSALWLLQIYYDRESPLNDPLKLLLQIALISLLLAFLFELRLRVGKPGRRIWFAFTAVAVLALTVAAVPVLLLFLNGFALRRAELMFSVSMLFFALYLAGRLLAFTRRPFPNLTVSEEADEPAPDRGKKDMFRPDDLPEEDGPLSPDEIPTDDEAFDEPAAENGEPIPDPAGSSRAESSAADSKKPEPTADARLLEKDLPPVYLTVEEAPEAPVDYDYDDDYDDWEWEQLGYPQEEPLPEDEEPESLSDAEDAPPETIYLSFPPEESGGTSGKA